VVPVAAHEDGAARGVAVAIGNPNPVSLSRVPVARSPTVTAVLPSPDAGHPEVISRRSGAGGADLQRLGRHRQHLHFLYLLRGPEAGDPLETGVDFRPVARHPATAGGYLAPYAAHPDVVIQLITPHPVTGDPFDV